MRIPELIEAFGVRGFVVSHEDGWFVGPCPCCQYWLTAAPHPPPPPDVTPDDEVPCLRFREWKKGVQMKCSALCCGSGADGPWGKDWVWGLLGFDWHASRGAPCRATTYCLVETTGKAPAQQSELEKFLDLL